MLSPESSLVPYQLSELPAGPWLVFAPHADDETFGMGGSLLLARDRGIPADVVVLTDGALGGAAPDLVAIRQAEVTGAAALLGVRHLHCWAEADRSLSPDNEALISRITALIIGRSPGAVFFPAPLELHPDHRATAGLVWAALQELKKRETVLPAIYGYEISVQSPVNTLIDITVSRAGKEAVMAVYASQNSENNYQELVLALNKARTFTLPPHVSHAEAFCQYPSAALGGSLREATAVLLERYWP
jgi:LmbE family N-acetylglucosaminyl deacetylase